MLELCTPRGLPVQVPETPAEDPSPRFAAHESAAIQDYYRNNGYVIVSKLIAPEIWRRAAAPVGRGSQVLQRIHIPPGHRRRQKKHVFNENGWVMNPILNLQSLDPKRFPRFRKHANESILAASSLCAVFRTLLGRIAQGGSVHVFRRQLRDVGAPGQLLPGLGESRGDGGGVDCHRGHRGPGGPFSSSARDLIGSGSMSMGWKTTSPSTTTSTLPPW